MKTTEIEIKFPVASLSLGCLPVAQKNHYFSPKEDLSIRTRHTAGEYPELVAKKGVDPINGRDRIEYTIPTFTEIEQLDLFVQEIMGLTPWANWMRLRQSKTIKGFPCCLDINSGYGPILEIEGSNEGDILAFAQAEFGLTYALTPEDLKALTTEYVANWQDYYYPFLEGDRSWLNARKEIDARILG